MIDELELARGSCWVCDGRAAKVAVDGRRGGRQRKGGGGHAALVGQENSQLGMQPSKQN